MSQRYLSFAVLGGLFEIASAQSVTTVTPELYGGWEAGIFSYINTSFELQNEMFLTLDPNSNFNWIYTNLCTQSLVTSGASCNVSPTNVDVYVLTTSLLTGEGTSVTNAAAGGYQFSGNIYTGELQVVLTSGGLATVGMNSEVTTVDQITQANWNYALNYDMSGGFGLGPSSPAMQSVLTNGFAGWFLESGKLDYELSIAIPQSSTPATQFSYSGSQSHLKSLFNPSVSTQTLTVTAVDGAYTMSQLGFGVFYPSGSSATAYYSNLNFTGVSSNALISPSMLGLGLPESLWNQVVSLMFSATTIDLASIGMNCNGINENGVTTGCQIPGIACTDSSLSNLWNFSFKVSLSGTTQNMYMPLSLLAYSDIYNNCNLDIQSLQSTNVQSSNVVIGAMLLQQYQALVQYQTSGATTTQTLSLVIAPSITCPNCLISPAIFPPAPDPFPSYLNGVVQIFFNTETSTIVPQVYAQLGGQNPNYVQMMVDMFAQGQLAFAQNCLQKITGLTSTSCENKPLLATNYFDVSGYTAVEQIDAAVFTGGFNTSGAVYNTAVCLNMIDAAVSCTTEVQVLIVNQVYKDYWFYDQKAFSGTFGLGYNSPIWTLFNNKQYDVQLAITNDWSSWWPNCPSASLLGNTIHQIYLGGYGSASSYTGAASVTLSPMNSESNMFGLTEFGFGQQDIFSHTEYFHSLLNNNTNLYESYANSSQLALNFRGLGLPPALFAQFSNLLSILTDGQAICENIESGFCILPLTCQHYGQSTNLFNNFSFKIKFQGNSNYLVIPLATFAKPYQYMDDEVCAIYIEPNYAPNSKSIIFGAMFFQSIYAQIAFSAQNTVSVNLYTNQNAKSTYTVQSTIYGPGTSPFIVKSRALTTDPNAVTNGLPTFNYKFYGVDSLSAYYIMDFTSPQTLLWAQNCTTTAIANYTAGSCQSNPTLTTNGYSATENATITKYLSSFTKQNLSGFTVSGNVYTSGLCLNMIDSSDCRALTVYAVSQISADNWLYNIDAGYGVIGMGPTSQLWSGLVNEYGTAVYSIAIARASGITDAHGNSVNQVISSNITLGNSEATAYTGTTLNLVANQNNTYSLNNLSFGIVYQTNGVDNSSYFQTLGSASNQSPVTFTTSIQGLGLPTAMYNSFVILLQNITLNAAVCETTTDGVCTMPNPCSNYTNFSNYNFLFNFTSSNSIYMRVPLATFAQNIAVSGSKQQCVVNVNYLNSGNAQSNNVILGGMFFQEFFGVFTNTYSNTTYVNQTAEIYLGLNAIYQPYIGSEILDVGSNPFTPAPTPPAPTPTPTPPAPTPTPTPGGNGTKKILIISISCGLLILVVLIVILCYRRHAKSQKENDQNGPSINNSQSILLNEDALQPYDLSNNAKSKQGVGYDVGDRGYVISDRANINDITI